MISDAFNIFEIYSRYCDIISKSDHACSRDILNLLLKSLESRENLRASLFGDLSKLMSCLNLSVVDSYQFNCFYGFVYFMCRENGQKNITVSRAISAWKLVLTGRFRLLNQWCDFIEKNQKHNISEDTWQQLLAFSRCVNEDLEGYDPKGAWPVLIDDFVDHMYRANQSSICCGKDFCCSCGDMDSPGITHTFSGLNLHPGFKRKLVVETDIQCDATPMSYNNSSTNVEYLMRPKRMRQAHMPKKICCFDICAVNDTALGSQDDANRHNLIGCKQTSPSACAVEDCLSKGFEGRLSIHHQFQFEQESRVSYT